MLPQPSSFLELRHASTDHAIFVVVPERRFLAIDGVGEPLATDFKHATHVLRTIDELVRKRLRQRRVDETRPRVNECSWQPRDPLRWDQLAAAFQDRSTWRWQQLIELPDPATGADIRAAIDEARLATGRGVPPVRVERFAEGSAAQVLHVGGRDTERETVAKLLGALAESGLRPRGPLHVLVLADPDDVPIDRARSIIRQPFEVA